MKITDKRAFLAKTILTFGDDKNNSLIMSSVTEAFRVLPDHHDTQTIHNKSLKLYKSLISSFSTKHLKRKFKKLYIYNESKLKSYTRKELMIEIMSLGSSKINKILFSDIRIEKNLKRLYRI